MFDFALPFAIDRRKQTRSTLKTSYCLSVVKHITKKTRTLYFLMNQEFVSQLVERCFRIWNVSGH